MVHATNKEGIYMNVFLIVLAFNILWIGMSVIKTGNVKAYFKLYDIRKTQEVKMGYLTYFLYVYNTWGIFSLIFI